MTNQASIPIYIASAHYGLEDLRAELVRFIEEELRLQPLISSENGFPDYPGMPPYAQCIKVLENALMVIGIVDRRYGTAFDDWGPFPEYKQLSPAHAEFRHALTRKKRFYVYVRTDVYNYYDVYRRNPKVFGSGKLPKELDAKTLSMLMELKHANPAPWIEPFNDIRDIKESFRKKLNHVLHWALHQPDPTQENVEEVLDKLIIRNPKIVGEITAGASNETDVAFTVLSRGAFNTPIDTYNVMLALRFSDLKLIAERGLGTKIVEAYEIAFQCLRDPEYIFRGIASPLQARSIDEVLIYTGKPDFSVDWDRGRNEVIRKTPPKDCVYNVIISPNRSKREFPNIDGWVEMWGWVKEDDNLANAPDQWAERYSELVWSKKENNRSNPDVDHKIQPIAYYDRNLDCIRVYLSDCSIVEHRINRYVTIAYESETEERLCAGMIIKGVMHLFEGLGLPLAGDYKLEKVLKMVVESLDDPVAASTLKDLCSELWDRDITVEFG